MALWVDKYRPSSLAKLSLHGDITAKLCALADSPELPHLLFYGPSGAGKKTRATALLREIFGSTVDHVKLETKKFKTPSNKEIEITTLGSNYHIECNPSDAANNDRFVIQEVIKEIASHSTLTAQSTASNGKRNFKVVLLTEVDRLTKQAQAGLRRTMEKYSSQCRIILICNSSSKIIEPIRSRCLGIRVPLASHEQVADVLMTVAKRENSPCPLPLALRISEQCDRNVRRGLLMLEACKVQHSPLQEDQLVPLPDWETYICRIAKEILSEQSPTKLLHIRDMLYELLSSCIPADIILTTLTRELLNNLDDQLKHELTYWAAYYEHRIKGGAKEIIHLEAFVAKFMAIYKRWIVAMFS